MTDEERLHLIKVAINKGSPIHPSEASFLATKLDEARRGIKPQPNWILALLEWQDAISDSLA